MSVVYVTKQGARITKQSRRLVVTAKNEIVPEIPDFKIERLVIFGNADITTPALAFLLDRGIETSFLSVRGRLRGRLIGKSSKNVFLRISQFKSFEDPIFVLNIARSVVKGKVKSMIEVAESQRLKKRLEGIFPLIEQKKGISALRGIEGFASAIYFSYFAEQIPDYAFAKRQHRPAFDPVNACLNLGYTLIGNEIGSMIEALGLDPHLGFYHQPAYGRPSLALDVLEEFRHILIDKLVVYLFRKRWLKEGMFVETENGVRLSDESFSTYLANYEEKAAPFREIIRKQAEHLVNCIRNREVYRPYVLSGGL